MLQVRASVENAIQALLLPSGSTLSGRQREA